MVRRGFFGLLAAAAMAAAALLTACGGAGFNGPPATLRFVNATSAYAALDLVVGNRTVAAGAAFGQGNPYAEVDPERAATTLRDTANAGALASFTPSLTRSRAHTLIAYGGASAVKALVIEDEEPPDAGQAKLRVINAAPDAGPVDVYLLAPGQALTAATPSHPGVVAGSASGFVTRAAGDRWQLRITAAGDKSDPRLLLENFVLSAGQIVNLVLTPSTGGALVEAIRLEQKGDVAVIPAAQARVRLAVPGLGSVSATVAGRSVAAGLSGPFLGAYEIVAAGTQEVTVNWLSTTLVFSKTFASGTDQTLLIHSVGGQPGGLWSLDDNRTPTAQGKAKVRLLLGLDFLGLDGLQSPVELKVDGLPVASELVSPTASGDSLVDAGNPEIIVKGGDRERKLTAPLSAGGVYTIFPMEGKDIVRRDR